MSEKSEENSMGTKFQEGLVCKIMARFVARLLESRLLTLQGFAGLAVCELCTYVPFNLVVD